MAVLTTSHEGEVEHSLTSQKPVAVQVSVVIPVVERCGNLSEIYRAHAEVLREKGYSFEFVFVVDAGFEKNGQGLDLLVASGEPVRVVQLVRQFGEATALEIGFDQARGDKIVCLASYFQTVPNGLARVLDTLDQGYDLVISRRYPRTDFWMNQFQNVAFHSLIRWFTGVQFHDLGCGLKGMNRCVARELLLYGDLHRFLPLLAYQKGFRLTEIDVPQHTVDQTVRVYGFGVYLRRLLDILTIVFLFKFTKKPLRFFGLIGTSLFGAGFGISFYLAAEKVLGLGALADRPLLILGVLLMVLGVQMGSIGLLGEIIIFTHARKMKDYTIQQFLK